jgi:diguanylate cyclase (GGDEF)-like protein/PAS domain S-box-containing protein
MPPSTPSENTTQNGQLISTTRVAFGALGIILLLVLTSAISLVSSHRETIAQQQVHLRNLSFALSAQTVVTVQAVNLALSEVQQGFLLQKMAGDPPGQSGMARFRFQNPGEPDVTAIYLFSIDGAQIATAYPAGSRQSGSGEMPAPPHPLAANQQMRVDVLNPDGQTGIRQIAISRRLLAPDGQVLGVMMATVESKSFQHLYDAVQLGAGGSVTLENMDGVMLVRGPTLPQWIGKSLREMPLFTKYLPISHHGAFEATSPVDGKRRLYGYDVVDRLPLVIITAIDKADALASWNDQLRMTAILLCAAISLVLFMAWRVMLDSRRQRALIDKLAGSEIRLSRSADYLKKILNAIDNPISVVNSGHRTILKNDAFNRLAGSKGNGMLSCAVDAEAPASAEGGPEWEKICSEVMRSGEGAVVEREILDGTGHRRTVLVSASRLTNAEGEVQIVEVLTDITERKKAEVHLAYVADFDTLTGLSNLSRFRRRLDEMVANRLEPDQSLGVLIVLLQRLHEINDLLGHEASDEAVVAAANVLRTLPFKVDCIARVSSSEFAVLIHCDSPRVQLVDMAVDLHFVLAAPVTVLNREFFLGPVVGGASYPHDASSADELLRLADASMHRAAGYGREPVNVFSRSTHVALDEQLALEGQLRRAMVRNEFRVVYQPKVDIASGRIVGFEALLRWSNALFGDVAPARFIPVAEATGLIVEIGAWVLQQACGETARWSAQRGEPVKVAVNLSLRQFHQRDLIPMITRCLNHAGLPASSLELEITESTVMSGPEEVDRLMAEIRALGVDLSIDDFGTGYSSLAYLKRFPVQTLKIDRSFINDLGKDEQSVAIVRSIVTLGHGLKLRVVAEGVETPAQLATLAELSCDEFQGFLFSRPVERDDVLEMLSRDGPIRPEQSRP